MFCVLRETKILGKVSREGKDFEGCYVAKGVKRGVRNKKQFPCALNYITTMENSQ